MRTKAVRIYGKSDLRLEEFELPEIGEDEILAKVWSDSLCMSSYKAAMQGAEHKRVPDDVAEHPTIIGHEFCGELVEIGEKWKHKFKVGQKFTVQPAMNYKGSPDAPGYSFRTIGGDATYIVIPNVVMETDCLLPYEGESWFGGSLAEPMSCIVGTYHATYHTTNGVYTHDGDSCRGRTHGTWRNRLRAQCRPKTRTSRRDGHRRRAARAGGEHLHQGICGGAGRGTPLSQYFFGECR